MQFVGKILIYLQLRFEGSVTKLPASRIFNFFFFILTIKTFCSDTTRSCFFGFGGSVITCADKAASKTFNFWCFSKLIFHSFWRDNWPQSQCLISSASSKSGKQLKTERTRTLLLWVTSAEGKYCEWCLLPFPAYLSSPFKAKEFARVILNSRNISVRHLPLGCQNSTSFPKKVKVALEVGSSHHPLKCGGVPAQLNTEE